jgi:glucose dehydrogenase
VLYTSISLSRIAAIDEATGETKWVFAAKIYENGLGKTSTLTSVKWFEIKREDSTWLAM